MNTMLLDGSQLTIDQVIAVAFRQAGAPDVALAADPRQRVTRPAQAVQQLLDNGVVAYGITTGFGAFKDRIIPVEEVKQLQRNIVMSHAVGVGAPFDRATTRAILLIRANTLARGHSGVRPATLDLLLALLNRGVHPVIPCKGSLGASGDLAPLAHMALVMIGLGEAEVDGQVLSGADALAAKGLTPVTLAAKEGLALTNGTAVMAALGTLEAWRARALSRVRRPYSRTAPLSTPDQLRRLSARVAGGQRVHPPCGPDQCAGRVHAALHSPGARCGARRHRLRTLGHGDRT